MSGNSSRKGTPIQNPIMRKGKLSSSSSSHALLSPMNTLDSKSKNSSPVPLPPKKHENPLSKSYSTSSFPIKFEKLPSAYTGGGYTCFKSLLQKYPEDTFSTEKEALSSVITNQVNVLSDCESDDEKEDEKSGDKHLFDDYFDVKSCYSEKKHQSTESFFASYAPESPERTIIRFDSPSKISKSSTSQSSLNVPLNSFLKPKSYPTLKVSNVQYRSIMLPRSINDPNHQNLKLIFLPVDKIVSLVGDQNRYLTITFAKISRVQFIRNENLASSDWYIDFVLNCSSLDFEPFGIFPNLSTAESITFQNCNTLRINLANNCGLSIESIENILLPILRDRNAFFFTTKRDPYGEFEKTNNSSGTSPKRQTPTKTRVVPSLESLSSSDSVKINTSAIKRNSNSIFQTNIFIPQVRKSSRLNSSTKVSPKKSNSDDSVYLDPNFESERVILFTYPEGEMDSVYVTSHELERLAPRIWLNDTIIDFELKFLLAQMDQSIQSKVHIFSSFFYRRLSSAKLSLTPPQDGSKTGFDLIKSWTKKVNLFEKDYLIVPICENLHWFLAIICHPAKMLAEIIEDSENEQKNDEQDSTTDNKDDDDLDIKLSQESKEDERESFVVDLDPEPIESTKIYIFDSLGLASRGKGVAVINRLRTYLQLEAKDKLKRASSKTACTGHVVKVPQQENYTDCGCFLLQFAEEFIRAIPSDIVNTIQEQNNDMSDWFPSALAQNRREIMRKRVEQLAQDFAHREKLKKPKEEHEDRSSDIEEIFMLPSK